jgi:hypothetical protein
MPASDKRPHNSEGGIGSTVAGQSSASDPDEITSIPLDNLETPGSNRSRQAKSAQSGYGQIKATRYSDSTTSVVPGVSTNDTVKTAETKMSDRDKRYPGLQDPASAERERIEREHGPDLASTPTPGCCSLTVGIVTCGKCGTLRPSTKARIARASETVGDELVTQTVSTAAVAATSGCCGLC